MNANLALLALIYGVEETANEQNSTTKDIRNIIQQADIEAHPFFEKIREKIGDSIKQYGIEKTSDDYSLPHIILKRLKSEVMPEEEKEDGPTDLYTLVIENISRFPLVGSFPFQDSTKEGKTLNARLEKEKTSNMRKNAPVFRYNPLQRGR